MDEKQIINGLYKYDEIISLLKTVKFEHDHHPEVVFEYQAGEVDDRQLYLESYVAYSTAPNRSPAEIPPNATLNKGRREDAPTSANTILLSMDIIS